MTDARPALARSLRAVARAIGPARDPWWVVGSAALVLHGVDPGPVGDIDLLASAADAAALLRRVGVVPAPGVADDRFRSAVFGRWTAADVVAEVMGDLHLRAAAPDGGDWRPVRPVTRERVALAGAVLFVPSRAELAALLRRFGRAKDLARAALLDQAGPAPRPRSPGPNASGSSSDRR